MYVKFQGVGGHLKIGACAEIGQNRIRGWMGGQKITKNVGHHLCTFPNPNPNNGSSSNKPRNQTQKGHHTQTVNNGAGKDLDLFEIKTASNSIFLATFMPSDSSSF